MPVFTLSLDTELAWGFVLNPEHRNLALLRSNLQQARETIHFLLKLFEKYQIRATWAIVGHLFLSPGEEKSTISSELPQFKEGWLDWSFYQSMNNNPLYWGRDIVEKILASPIDHDIGLHGFFHLPFSQCSRAVAKAEIELGIKAADRFGINPKSFVFPQNKIGHIDVLKENGIEIYRGKDLRWWREKQERLIRKFDSGIHKMIAAPASPIYQDGVWELPASTYFCAPGLPFTVLPRCRLGLERTIRGKKVFHIWLHDWSLLLYDRLAADLEYFLALVTRKRNEGKIEVMTMGEIASSLAEGRN